MLGAWIERKAWQTNGGGSLAMFDEPTASFAARTLSELHRKVLKRGRHFRHLTPEARHKLRLAVKKLRYAADFFLTALGHRRIGKHYLRRLGQPQDQLGRYNDMAVTEHFVERLVEVPLGLRTAGRWHNLGLAGARADCIGAHDAGCLARIL
jgi:triphosphatase